MLRSTLNVALVIALLGPISGVQAQIDINEVVHADLDQVLDEDGESSEWFELYNTSGGTIDLEGYRITDNNDPNRWVFPRVRLGAGERLVVLASGKNRAFPVVDHWETVISEEQDHSYFEGTSEPIIGWNTPSADISGWLEGPGGFGFGDGDDATVTSPSVVSVYVRREFQLNDPSLVVDALLSVDYDDGFVAYLNGVEVARRNMDGLPTYTTLAVSDREAQVYFGGAYETVEIDRGTLAGALVAGVNVFAIQVHNASPVSTDLTIRSFLHVGLSEPGSFYMPIPAFLEAPEARPLHTNFKLGLGEDLRLRDPDGVLVSAVQIPNDLQPGHARARIPDGGPFCYSPDPTPGAPNIGPCAIGYAEAPVFSVASGFYQATQSVSLEGVGVRYETDGSDPTVDSPLYTAEIPIPATAVVRAKSFEAGRLPSVTSTANYFIGEPTTLPVVSINADPAVLFGENGVYDAVPQGGGLPRVACHVQYYDADRTLAFENPAGFQVIGNYTLLYPQKGMEFTCKDRFGSPETMDHVIFPRDKPSISRFNDFRIKNADNETVRMRDLVANRMAVPTHNVTAGFGNVAAYINGEYWGHYNSRERLDENFFARNFGVDPDSVDVIKSVSFTPEFFDASNGTTDAFFSMRDLVLQNDMTDSASFAAVAAEVDIENWIDFYATRIYLADYDWMWEFQNNTMLFKSHSPDLKWKYVLWDCANTQNTSAVTRPDMDYLTNIFTNGHESDHKRMINALLENDGFRELFINRFADLMNYYYTTDRVLPIIEENLAEMLPEMNAHGERWGTADSLSLLFNVEYELESFHAQRPAHQRDHIEGFFSLDGQVELTLRVEPEGWGRVMVSTITPTPDELPWTGVYFHGVPVTVTAVPEPDYAFDRWDNDPNVPDTLAASFSHDFDASTVLTAHFRTTTTSVTEQTGPVIRVHPNPSAGLVQLEGEAPFSYDVRDVLGRSILQDSRVGTRFSVDLTGQPDGVYFLTMTNERGRRVQRLVKQAGGMNSQR